MGASFANGRSSRLETIYTAYVSPLSFFFWTNRAVYIGIIVSALILHDSFWGQFNLLFPVDARLFPVTLGGLIAHDVGVLAALKWFGGRTDDFSAPRHTGLAVPLGIFVIATLASCVLFWEQGIPLFVGALHRADLGPGAGLLKRFMYTLLPLSAIEVYFISVWEKRFRVTAVVAIIVATAILMMLTFKAKLFFFFVYLALAGYLACPKSPTMRRRSIASAQTVGFALLLGISVYLYANLAHDKDQGSFATVMLARSTVLVAQAPNYVMGAQSGLPSAIEVLESDLGGVLQTLRIPSPFQPRMIDTELTQTILGDDSITAGGLNPTVVGYGWLVGGVVGVAVLSLLYGILCGYFIRRMQQWQSSLAFVASLFGAVAVFEAIQIFSPVSTLLETGLSVVLYITLSKLLVAFLAPFRRPAPTLMAAVIDALPAERV